MATPWQRFEAALNAKGRSFEKIKGIKDEKDIKEIITDCGITDKYDVAEAVTEFQKRQATTDIQKLVEQAVENQIQQMAFHSVTEPFVPQHNFDEDFITLRKLSDNWTAQIWLCKSKSTGLYAIAKKLVSQSPVMEVKILTELKGCQNVAELLAHYYDSLKDEHILIFPLYSPQPYVPATEQQLQLYMFELLQALKYCADKNIVHADLSPNNILYDDRNNHIRLIDYGFSAHVGTKWTKPLPGTSGYMSPEHERATGTYQHSMDMWSAGIIFQEMLKKVDLTGSSAVSKDLLRKMLHSNPNKRKTARSALKHKYFKPKPRRIITRSVLRDKDKIAGDDADAGEA